MGEFYDEEYIESMESRVAEVFEVDLREVEDDELENLYTGIVADYAKYVELRGSDSDMDDVNAAYFLEAACDKVDSWETVRKGLQKK